MARHGFRKCFSRLAIPMKKKRKGREELRAFHFNPLEVWPGHLSSIAPSCRRTKKRGRGGEKDGVRGLQQGCSRRDVLPMPESIAWLLKSAEGEERGRVEKNKGRRLREPLYRSAKESPASNAPGRAVTVRTAKQKSGREDAQCSAKGDLASLGVRPLTEAGKRRKRKKKRKEEEGGKKAAAASPRALLYSFPLLGSRARRKGKRKTKGGGGRFRREVILSSTVSFRRVRGKGGGEYTGDS